MTTDLWKITWRRNCDDAESFTHVACEFVEIVEVIEQGMKWKSDRYSLVNIERLGIATLKTGE